MGETPRPKQRWRTVAAVCSALLLFAAAGCADDDGETTTGDTSAQSTTTTTADVPDATTAPVSELPQITVDATDHAFEFPEEVPSGWVDVTMTNSGEEPHHLQLARFNDGATMDDLGAAFADGDEAAAFELITFVGGPGAADPGGETSAIVELEPGAHVALCFMPDADGVPHIALGMVTPFEVTESDEPAAEPVADSDIVLDDYTIEMPEDFTGTGTFRVVNEGEEPHEVIFARLEDGKTPADAAAWAESMDGPPPFTYAGGMQGITPGGGAGYLSLELEDGTYLAICAIPDSEGTPHIDLGMISMFIVGDAPDDMDDGADDMDDGEEPDEG